MELNLAMQFVLLRAYEEAKAFSKGELGTEHVFLGLLKLAELKCADFAPSHEDQKPIDEDIRQVADDLKKRNVQTAGGRQQLRRILKNESLPPSAQEQLNLVLGSAAYHAEKDGQSALTAYGVLGAILRHPTPMLKNLLSGDAQKAETQTEPEEQEMPPEEPEEVGLAYLPKLNERIREMRYRLLERVYGQDHAVHALAEGMFSAEVLALADEKRKQPRAVFAFVGPPGVGKTYLAEQAADTLKLPFKRFDMSSYADHQAHISLIGFAPSYKDAKPGMLTEFVKKHPHSILLLDEIEKAHLNTIQLFLQILDAGRLHDDFLDEDVSFKDTLIIFTTNAGSSLYDNVHGGAGVSRQTILNTLETETNPQTHKPYFPPAICSRLATGWPLLFNRLSAHDLERICAKELTRFSQLFEKQYGIRVDTDQLLPATLLFAEGGLADARTIRAQTELFCKNEIFKLCGLWGESSFEKALENLTAIHFQVETSELKNKVRALYVNPEKPEILLFGNAGFAERCRAMLPDCVIYDTLDNEQAYTIFSEHDIQFVLLDLAKGAENAPDEDPLATRLSLDDVPQGTVASFENVPIAAASIKTEYAFLKDVRERMPGLPIYLLESNGFRIDNELMAAFMRSGARGKLLKPEGDFGVFAEELLRIAAQVYLQSAAQSLHSERKILSFETAPILSPDKHVATIRLRDLALRREMSAEDTGEVLEEAERPDVRFPDVIGADDAKDELAFFVEYLQSPKKFLAQGLHPPKGVLLYGPPGTGKTMLARAMAGESNVAFLSVAASAFTTKYQGSGPESVRELFRRARRYAPSIVFIDEIDAVGRLRGAGNTGHGEEMALTALLTEMDGFSVDPRRPVFVLAATNFGVDGERGSANVIDPALVRRFDRKILVDMPTRDNRKTYLERMLNKRKDSAVTAELIDRLAGRTTGLSLANLESVIELAARTARKQKTPITNELLEEALELSRHGEKKDWGIDYLERVARHEAGHAYLCYLTGETPAYLTIVARGGHGGYMEYSDTEQTPIRTREELLWNIRTALGGRAAELTYYGKEGGLSTGAAGDLEHASRTASAMLMQYGMEGRLGLAAFNHTDALKGPLSELIVDYVSKLLEEELQKAVKTIEEGKPKIDRLVKALLDKNKLTREEIESILAE